MQAVGSEDEMKEKLNEKAKQGLLRRLWERYVTKELILYGIAGVMTTLVNAAACFVLYNLLRVNENITTVVGWVVAVAFAYVVNNVWVFGNGNEGAKVESAKISKFIGARLVTLGIEWLGVFIFVTTLKWNYWLVKLPLAVLVILFNYIFSKLFIFIKKK